MRIAFDIDGVFTDYEWFLNEYGEYHFCGQRKLEISDGGKK